MFYKFDHYGNVNCVFTRRVLINQFVPPTFCLSFAFTDVNLRGMLHHVFDVANDGNMC